MTSNRKPVLVLLMLVALMTVIPDVAMSASNFGKYLEKAEVAEARGDWYEAVKLYRLALQEKSKKKIMDKLAAAEKRAAAMKAGEIQSVLNSMGVYEPEGFKTLGDVDKIDREIEAGFTYDRSNAALGVLAEFTANGRATLANRQTQLAEAVDSQLTDQDWEAAKKSLDELQVINSSAPAVRSAQAAFETAVESHFGELISDAENVRDIVAASDAARTASRLTGTSNWQRKADFYDQLRQAETTFRSGQVADAYSVISRLKDSSVNSAIFESLRGDVTKRHCEELVSEAETLIGERYWMAIHRLKEAADLGDAVAVKRLSGERDKATAKLDQTIPKLLKNDRCGQVVFAIQAYAAGFGSPGKFGSSLTKCDATLRQRIPKSATLELAFQGINKSHESLLSASLNSAVRSRYGAMGVGEGPLKLKLTVGSEYVNTNEYTRSDSVQYVRSQRSEPNPKWNTWKSTRDLTYQQTDNQFLRAAVDAAEPARTISVPVYDNHTYQIQVKEVDGSLSGDLEAVFATFEGTKLNLLYKSNSASFRAQDEGHGAFGPGRLAHDPLQVPNDMEVVRSMAEDLAKSLVPTQQEIEGEIVSAFKTRAEELVLMGEQGMAVEYIMTLMANGHGSEKLTNWLKENVL